MPPSSMRSERPQTAWARIKRRARLAFIVPLLRSTHPPEYIARGIAVGIFWAFTPLIPIQTYLFGLTWMIARRSARLDFHPLIGLAWVFVTNALTMIPVYFVFYVTGEILLGNWGDPIGYRGFQDKWDAVANAGGGVSSALDALAAMVVGPFGAALFVGCLPYAVGGAAAGYVVGLRALHRRDARRRRAQRERSMK